MTRLTILLSTILLINCSGLKTVELNNLLHFRTDDNYLVLHVLINTKKNQVSDKSYSKDILNFQNAVWTENKSDYERLLNNIKKPSQLTYLNFKNYYEEEHFSLIEKSKKLKEFQKLKRQMDVYSTLVKNVWSNQFIKTQKIISILTGLDLNKQTHVIITHPELKNGRNLNGEWIEWGGYNDPNYIVTYLWHETLHQYFDKSNLSHSIIELISDNELNKTLTGNDYPPLRGHSQLEPIKKCLLNDWQTYLSSPSKNIVSFMQSKKNIDCGELLKNLNW